MSQERDYLHGYTKEEQARLIEQARILAPYIYEGVDFSQKKKLLEVGCGVGAQTEILLKKYSQLEIHGVDVSSHQLDLARERLSSYISSGRLKLTCADATRLDSIQDSGFDCVYLCWFLEHVYEPLEVLKSIKKAVGTGVMISITEVNNSSLFIDPYSSSIFEYWNQLNDYQWSIQGHPFIGLQIANQLQASGYQQIQSFPRHFLFDSRKPAERKQFLKYFFGIFKSANENLVKKGRIHHELIHAVERDFEAASENDMSVFYYSYVHTLAIT